MGGSYGLVCTVVRVKITRAIQEPYSDPLFSFTELNLPACFGSGVPAIYSGFGALRPLTCHPPRLFLTPPKHLVSVFSLDIFVFHFVEMIIKILSLNNIPLR